MNQPTLNNNEAADLIPNKAFKQRVILQSFTDGIYRYTLEKIHCGKTNCRSCPHPKKGGYWYVAWTVKGRTMRKYIGKKLKVIVSKKSKTSNHPSELQQEIFPC